MQFASIVMAAGIAIGLALSNQAGAGDQLDAEHWVEAQSLRELPAGIQALLGVGLGAAGGIADRGDSYNAGDVIVDNLPGRRFALGIVDGDKAVVAVERGGHFHSVETMEFRQMGATWEAVRCVSSFKPPQRPADLLDMVAARQPDGGPCPGFTSRFTSKLRPGG